MAIEENAGCVGVGDVVFGSFGDNDGVAWCFVDFGGDVEVIVDEVFEEVGTNANVVFFVGVGGD